ncbi:MAG: ABC transporter permease [Actinomycetota bacterium]|nr:ABC transporter permease [Actinomycetota bacterium]
MTAPALALPSDRRFTSVSRGRAWVAGAAGALFVGFFAVLALLGEQLAPYRATELAGTSLEAPSRQHLLGTTVLGNDVASQLILGARASLTIALLAGLGTVLLGGIVGVTAGWFRGWVDAVLMRVTDVVLVLPKLPLLLLVGALTGGRVAALSVLIAATFWPVPARILRSQVLTLRTRTHVRAATGFGAGTAHQLRRHILPDLTLLSIAELIPAASRAVALQAGLAFLGVGDPAQPSWGAMMRDAIAFKSLFLTPAWKWWLVPPILAVVILVAGISLLGTAAERHLSPRVSRHAR